METFESFVDPPLYYVFQYVLKDNGLENYDIFVTDLCTFSFQYANFSVIMNHS